MIPASIAAPPPAVPRRPRWRWPRLTTVAGVVLIVVGLGGAALWLAVVSPYGFVRFPAREAARVIDLRHADSYLVFEEYAGAADPGQVQTPLVVSVVGERGEQVRVTPLGGASSAGRESYQVPGHEGRAIARFEAQRSGRYLITATPRSGATGNDVTVAVGRELAVSWVGSPLVAGACVLMAVAGLVCLVVSGLGRLGSRSAKPREPTAVGPVG